MGFKVFLRGFAFASVAVAAHGLAVSAVLASPQTSETSSKASSDVVDTQISRQSVTSFIFFVGAQIARFGGNLGPAIQTVDLGTDATGQEGMAAGYELERFAGWANFANTNMEEDVVATRYKGDMRTYMVGADYQWDEDLLFGVAFGMDRSEVNTQFNGGTINTRTRTISPYASYRIDDMFSVNGMLGYSRGDIDQVRFVGAAPVTSDTTTDRFFAQVGGNVVATVPTVDNMLLSGDVGLLYAFERVNAFTETNGTAVPGNTNPLTQLQLGMRAGYSFFDVAEGWVFHPYTQLRFITDIQSNNVDVGPGQAQHPNDPQEAQYAFGVDFFSGARWSGNLEYQKSFARRDFTSSVFSVNLRVKLGDID